MLDLYDGEYLMREGEMQTDAFLVTRGAFVVEQGEVAEPGMSAGYLTAVLIEPENPVFVGEMAWLGSFARTASVRCSGHTQALRLKPDHMELILAHFPVLTRALCRQFAERLKATNGMLHRFQELAAMKAGVITMKAGEIVIRRGDPATTLYQLVDGTLREEESGAEELGPEAFPGGFLHLSCYLAGRVWPRTLRTEGATMLSMIDESSKVAVIRNFPELVLAAMQEDAAG